MLIRLKVSNFKSFEKETTFTMISSSKIQAKTGHQVQFMSATSILKYAAIYGANAAGKSNLIEAFDFIKYCLQNSIPVEAVDLFCKNHENNINTPSTFDIQFSIGKNIYAYGFSVLMKKREFVSEWLYQLHQNGSAYPIFEWEKGSKPIIGDRIHLKGNDDVRIKTYIDDFEENSSALFLSVMNRGKKYTTESKLIIFKEIFNYLNDEIIVCTPKTPITDFQRYYDDASLTKIAEILNCYDTGITEMMIEDVTVDEISNKVPKPILDDIFEQIKKEIEKNNKKKARFSLRNESIFYNFEYENGMEIKITTLKIKHGKSFYEFSYEEESDGTRRLFEFIDMLMTNSNNKVYIIDEMERSLHPILTRKFIKHFNKIHNDDDVQLIFTTHESSIMDQNLFRRDEIWFVERDANNVSNLYSLDRFKERYDKKLSKSYLEGRYGAIPAFSDFSFMEE